MSPDKSLQNLFSAALERDDPGERARFLDEACGADAALRERVEKLLRAHEEIGGFMAQPSRTPTGFGGNPLTEKPGDRIGRYKLLQQIGEGGCGVVYMAEQEEPVRRRVALKVIKLGMDTKQVIARFEAERQALALMDHPNIAKVFDAGATGAPVAAGILPAVEPGFQPGGSGVDNSKHAVDLVTGPGGKMPPSTAGETPAATLSAGRPFFVMELVRGSKITEFCDENKLSTEERLNLFIQVCHAIQHAHQKGIIHRDIKPSNILVTINDGVAVPKVIDFGIAKATAGRLTDNTLFTAFEQFIGTPAYMSPEQAVLTSLDIDTRSDIYSLGVLLYELLTGSPPFDQKELLAAGLDEMRRTIREVEPAKPSTRLTQALVAADVSPLKSHPESARNVRADSRRLLLEVKGDLDWIAMKCLEKDRARRYETANALAADIRRHLDCEPVVARPPSRLYEFQKSVRRHKFGFAAAGAVIVALAIGLGVATWTLAKERQALRRAVAAEQEQSRLREEAQRDRAQAEANELKAGREAAKSRQVALFLQEMLKGVGPSVAMGRDTVLLKEILDRMAELVGKDLKDQPEVEAELRTTIGYVYYELHDFPAAEGMARDALRLRKEALGETNELVAASLSNLAGILGERGDLAGAEARQREALAIRRSIFGNDHTEVAQSLYRLGAVVEGLGRLADAENLYRSALAIQRKHFGNEHPETLESLNHVARTLKRRGRLVEAEKLEREALNSARKLGKEHPVLADALGSLGETLSRKGRLGEAEPFLREGYKMQRKVLGNDHPQLVSSLERLERVLLYEGKFSEVEECVRNHLATSQKANLSGDPRLERLAIALLGQDKKAEAEQAHRQAMAIRKSRALEPAKSSDASALNEAAWFLATSNEANIRDGARAVQLAEQAIKATGRKDAMKLDTLAAAYAEAGQFAQAASVQEEAMGLLQDTNQVADYASRLKLYTAHKPYRQPTFENNAAAWIATGVSYLLKHGKAVEAEMPARVCLAIRERELPDVWLTFNARSLLGGSLLGQKKYTEAEPLLLAGYEGMKQRESTIPPAGKVCIAESLQRLVQFYQATGQSEKVAEWNKKLVEFDQARAEK